MVNIVFSWKLKIHSCWTYAAAVLSKLYFYFRREKQNKPIDYNDVLDKIFQDKPYQENDRNNTKNEKVGFY